MINTELLRERIHKAGYTESFVADHLKISDTLLSRKMNNTSEFMTNEVQSLCALLGIVELSDKEDIFFSM